MPLEFFWLGMGYADGPQGRHSPAGGGQVVCPLWSTCPSD